MRATMVGGRNRGMNAMEELPNQLREQLRATRDLIEVGRVVRTAARTLTGAKGATFVLRDVDHCFYADEDAIAPLWVGQRFPMTNCISGWAMLNDETAIVPDIEYDDRIPIEVYRPTFVRSLVMVPVRTPEPAAAIGAYWSVPRTPLPDEVNRLEALAAETGVAIARIGLADAPWAPNFAVKEARSPGPPARGAP
jgi:GAF domain-containing protein